MSNTERKYTCKDVDMIIAADTIVDAAIANQNFLQSKRGAWKGAYFTDLKKQIDYVTQNCLGVDTAAGLRKASQAIASIQKEAMNDLAEAKVQIEEDFKSNKTKRDDILKSLGFDSNYKQIQKGNQEALVQLLYKFKTNLSKELMKEIAGQGTDESLLERITNYADTLKQAEVTQETYKGERPNITEANLRELNDIYERVISLCKIAFKFLKGQPAKQNQFSFNKVVKTLSLHPQKTPVQPES